MEINQPKRLHHHSLPILLVALAGFVFSFFVVQAYQNAGSTIDLKRALTSKLISIHTTSNGLARIAITPPAASSTTAPHSNLENFQNNVGATTALTINLQAAPKAY